jgi:DHA2 family multidrug resistance protein-like MFS transporter
VSAFDDTMIVILFQDFLKLENTLAIGGSMHQDTIGNSTAVNTPRAGRREWIGLAVIALPCLLYSMDLTVLHLAVPALTADLQPTSSQLLWILDIYGFLIAGSLITMGTLGDRIGRRKLLLIGAAAFGLASILAAFSTSPEMLIAARAVLGVAGATLAPSTLSLLRTMFPDPAQFTVAIGVWVSSFSAGAAIGPLAGGLLLERFWWGSVFLISVPVMLLLLAVGPALLPEYRDPEAGRLDLLSAALSLAAVLLVIFGLKQIAVEGLGVPPILSIVAGLAIGVWFLRRQRTLSDPLLDLGLFANRAFSTSLATYMVGILLVFGLSYYTAQYLQLVLGLSPFTAGLWTIPSVGAFILSSNIVPKLVRRFRPGYLVAGGLALAAVGVGLLTQVGVTSLPFLVAGSFVMSLGFGPVITLATDMIVGTAPPERAGAASGISETSAEFGGALGIAVLGSLGTAVYRNQVALTLPESIPPAATIATRETLGGAVVAAKQLPAPLADALLSSAREAFVQGLQLTAVIGAVGLAGMAFVAAILLRHVQTGSGPTQQDEFEAARQGNHLPETIHASHCA